MPLWRGTRRPVSTGRTFTGTATKRFLREPLRTFSGTGRRPPAILGLPAAERRVRAPVAQWIERRPPEPKVAGSNPVGRATAHSVGAFSGSSAGNPRALRHRGELPLD